MGEVVLWPSLTQVELEVIWIEERSEDDCMLIANCCRIIVTKAKGRILLSEAGDGTNEPDRYYWYLRCQVDRSSVDFVVDGLSLTGASYWRVGRGPRSRHSLQRSSLSP